MGHRAGWVMSGAGVVGLVMAGFGCGGDASEVQPSEGRQAVVAAAPPAAPADGGPTGPIDTALARRGEEVFASRGCSGCHYVGGGRLTGPDLAGVTRRRDFVWIEAMIRQPDSMLRVDPTARALFQEYLTPMSPLGITGDEARALYEYFRRFDADGGE